MGIALLLRTVVVTPWLAGILWRGTADLAAAVLAVALVTLWVVPLLRDRARHAGVGSQRGLAATKAAT